MQISTLNINLNLLTKFCIACLTLYTIHKLDSRIVREKYKLAKINHEYRVVLD